MNIIIIMWTASLLHNLFLEVECQLIFSGHW